MCVYIVTGLRRQRRRHEAPSESTTPAINLAYSSVHDGHPPPNLDSFPSSLPPARGTAENKTQYMSVLDFAQGFGAVQLAASMPTEGAPLGAFYHEHELASDELHYYLIYVSDASKNVSVTVAWFDPPSMVNSYNVSFFCCRSQGCKCSCM